MPSAFVLGLKGDAMTVYIHHIEGVEPTISFDVTGPYQIGLVDVVKTQSLSKVRILDSLGTYEVFFDEMFPLQDTVDGAIRRKIGCRFAQLPLDGRYAGLGERYVSRCLLVETIKAVRTSLVRVDLRKGARDRPRYQCVSPLWYRWSHLENHFSERFRSLQIPFGDAPLMYRTMASFLILLH